MQGRLRCSCPCSVSRELHLIETLLKSGESGGFCADQRFPEGGNEGNLQRRKTVMRQSMKAAKSALGTWYGVDQNINQPVDIY